MPIKTALAGSTPLRLPGRRRFGAASAVLFAALTAWPVQAATLLFPKGTVDVKLELTGDDCNDGSMIVCLTSLSVQRAYLLQITNNEAFVAAAYRVLLRRSVDAAGLSYYTNRLIGNTITRDRIIDELVASAEYRTLHP